MARLDPQVLDHLEWLGFVQPIGLVVSAPALSKAGAVLNRRDTEGQMRLRDVVEQRQLAPDAEPQPVIADFEAFARQVLGWSFSAKGYAGADGSPIPEELELPLPDYGETLRPDFAVRERDPAEGSLPWQLLVSVLDVGEDFDRVASAAGKLEASPRGRMERLLREKGIPVGLLCNGRALRLISAPRGESSGWLDFKVAEMTETAGRPICAAMRLLLSERRLLALPRAQRLAALLEDSRKFQNEVSEKLAQQVLHALYELLRGLQAAHDRSNGEILRAPLSEHPDDVYRALLTVVLRLVFLLYAEEREILPGDETFARYYSLAGLHERLRDDAAHYPDTMGQRYSAWAQLLALFRMVHDGAEWGDIRMPERHGALFDPDRFPFLEGRADMTARQHGERIEPPLVPDGTVYRVLDKLLVLDGERISYRALDVEQIGSVYETMMGFRLELATGRSVAVKAQSRHGAPTTADLGELLGTGAGQRAKWLQDRADRKLTPKVSTAVKEADTLEDLHAALGPVIDTDATPDLVPAGAMVLQPSEERRRSGSHYTPRALTEPIVRTTLEPVLNRLREDESLTPDEILNLKVCDPAMGSGAFLVEACRQLADALVEAWNLHGGRPEIPADEDEVVLARRMVAQRCLYGVDRNPVAVDLAKMSLWLVTLAREHPLTFLDHSLRHGDSLVGLSRRQIEAFHWDPSVSGFEAIRTREHLARVTELRALIREAGADTSDWMLRDMWDEVQAELRTVRLLGDLVVLAFFTGAKPTERETKRATLARAVAAGEAERSRRLIDEHRHADPPLVPFHWQVEFTEVFDRENGGFDVTVGNPPFLKGGAISTHLGDSYRDFLLIRHEASHGNSDLVAFFFRDTFDRTRSGGTLGLIATQTIAQGDTRSTGLSWIRTHGGEIYDATTRFVWPGVAAVTVSVVHVRKGESSGTVFLDGRPVNKLTSYLFYRGGDEDAVPLAANAGLSFAGSEINGQGFIFQDDDPSASPLYEMRRLVANDPRNGERIFPYLSGKEVNEHPTHAAHRYVIDFRNMTLAEAAAWPGLLEIVEARVKPDRDKQKRKSRRERWWVHGEHRPGLYDAIQPLDEVLVNSKVSQWLAFAFVPTGSVYSHNLNVFAFASRGGFCCLQSRVHEVWVRFTSSTLEDRLGYRPTDCFETFPLPDDWESDRTLGFTGGAYYDFRAELLIRNCEGLTKTYNRFHDPNETDPEILRLRELHAEMDRAVLAAYGWDDVPTECEFVLDHEVAEEDSSRRKKPYRFRWPDEVRDELLARLIELNAERAAAERRSGAAAAKQRKSRSRRPAPVPAGAEELF